METQIIKRKTKKSKGKQKAIYFQNKKIILEKKNNETEARYGERGEREESEKGR